MACSQGLPRERFSPSLQSGRCGRRYGRPQGVETSLELRRSRGRCPPQRPNTEPTTPEDSITAYLKRVIATLNNMPSHFQFPSSADVDRRGVRRCGQGCRQDVYRGALSMPWLGVPSAERRCIFGDAAKLYSRQPDILWPCASMTRYRLGN